MEGEDHVYQGQRYAHRPDRTRRSIGPARSAHQRFADRPSDRRQDHRAAYDRERRHCIDIRPGGHREADRELSCPPLPRGLLVTLYFDRQTGLLLRELRYGSSPIGRIPTQIDFADYRDVNDIKLPFRITYAWLDGRDAIVLNEIRTNVPVDEAKFARPAPLKPR